MDTIDVHIYVEPDPLRDLEADLHSKSNILSDAQHDLQTARDRIAQDCYSQNTLEMTTFLAEQIKCCGELIGEYNRMIRAVADFASDTSQTKNLILDVCAEARAEGFSVTADKIYPPADTDGEDAVRLMEKFLEFSDRGLSDS